MFNLAAGVEMELWNSQRPEFVRLVGFLIAVAAQDTKNPSAELPRGPPVPDDPYTLRAPEPLSPGALHPSRPPFTGPLATICQLILRTSVTSLLTYNLEFDVHIPNDQPSFAPFFDPKFYHIPCILSWGQTQP